MLISNIIENINYLQLDSLKVNCDWAIIAYKKYLTQTKVQPSQKVKHNVTIEL